MGVWVCSCANNQVLATEDSLVEKDLFGSEQARLKEAGDFWLLGQCDGVVLSPRSAFADRALSLAMHTPRTVRCEQERDIVKRQQGVSKRRSVKLAGDEADHSSTAEVNGSTTIIVNVTVVGWACRYVQLQDGRSSFPVAM
jgi:hypothetical protein